MVYLVTRIIISRLSTVRLTETRVFSSNLLAKKKAKLKTLIDKLQRIELVAVITDLALVSYQIRKQIVSVCPLKKIVLVIIRGAVKIKY